jgi:hypothetical protein
MQGREGGPAVSYARATWAWAYGVGGSSAATSAGLSVRTRGILGS